MPHGFATIVSGFHIHGFILDTHLAHIVMHTHHGMIHGFHVMAHGSNVHQLAWHSHNR
jgi:hypothetical protein